MQVNLKELSTQAIESTVGTKKMRLSENAQSMVFQLFTKNVYSNPIGTIVREITSNCFDSNVEAKVDTPVIIKLFNDKQTNSKYISFIDYGVGMSPDRVENIYGVYFESTKRVDNTQIGGWGIGGKTPLAYKRSTGLGEGEYDNSFFVITNFNGIKYSYLIFEGADTPVISLLHEEETSDRNGTEIRIPVLDKDIEAFSKEMVRQLYYFENVIFEGFDEVYKYNSLLTNNYQIVKGKTFLFRGADYSNSMHICLGRVAYPIDYTALGLNSSDYNIPVALKLEVGDIGVTVSRESLDYSESTIKILKKKLIETKEEIISMITKQYENIVTLEEYFNVKNRFGNLIFSDNKSLYVGNLIKQSDIDFSNFKYSTNFLKMPNDGQLFKLFFNVKSYGVQKSKSRYRTNLNDFDENYNGLKQNKNLFYFNDSFNRKVLKQSYLKYVHDKYHIISKRNLLNSDIISEISEIFNVHLNGIFDSNGIINSYVQSLIEMQKDYFTIVQKNAVDYDNVVVPDDFIATRKKRDLLSLEVRKTTIPVKFIRGNKDRVVIDDLLNYKMPIFYGTQENENELYSADSFFKLLFNENIVVRYYNSYHNNKFYTYDNYYSTKNKNNKQSIMFIMLSVSNIKYMKYCKNAMHISEFKHKMAYRKENMINKYFQSYDIFNNYDMLDSLYTDPYFFKLNHSWSDKINEVNSFILNTEVKKEIFNKRHLIENYININTTPNAEMKKIDNLISELFSLQLNNQKYLKYLRYNSLEYCDDDLIDIMKKIMNL